MKKLYEVSVPYRQSLCKDVVGLTEVYGIMSTQLIVTFRSHPVTSPSPHLPWVIFIPGISVRLDHRNLARSRLSLNSEVKWIKLCIRFSGLAVMQVLAFIAACFLRDHGRSSHWFLNLLYNTQGVKRTLSSRDKTWRNPFVFTTHDVTVSSVTSWCHGNGQLLEQRCAATTIHRLWRIHSGHRSIYHADQKHEWILPRLLGNHPQL